MVRHPARLVVGLTVLTALLVAGLAPVAPRAAEPVAGVSGERLQLTAAAPRAAAGTAPRHCRGHIALTFDDGPSARTTGRLVDFLERARVPATFFVVGQRVAGNGALLRRMQRSGFVIANHSWAHGQLTARSSAQVLRSLDATARALRRVGVRPSRLMRPPYGAINPRVRAVIRRAGLVPVMWTIDSEDWSHGNSDQIAGRILRALRRGDNIVLQHDGVDRSPISVRAVASVVRVARERGFCFTGLDTRGRPRAARAANAPETPQVTPETLEVTAGRSAPVVDRSRGPIPLVTWLVGFRFWN